MENRWPDEILKERIYKRILVRIKKGMIKEVKNLHDNGLSWKRMYDLGLEYRFISEYLQGKYKTLTPSLASDREMMIEKLNIDTWHYAKRQKTWFKRDKETMWIDPREIHETALVLQQIIEFLKP